MLKHVLPHLPGHLPKSNLWRDPLKERPRQGTLTSGRQLLGIDDFCSIFLRRCFLYTPSDHREGTPGERRWKELGHGAEQSDTHILQMRTAMLQPPDLKGQSTANIRMLSPPHGPKQMWWSTTWLPPRHLVPGQSNSSTSDWWAMLQIHTCCISLIALWSQQRQPGERRNRETLFLLSAEINWESRERRD